MDNIICFTVVQLLFYFVMQNYDFSVYRVSLSGSQQYAQAAELVHQPKETVNFFQKSSFIREKYFVSLPSPKRGKKIFEGLGGQE